MKITKIEIRKNENKEEKVRGYVTLEFDKVFVLKNIKIIDGDERMFVAMPSIKGTDGKYYDTAFPITKEFRSYIEEEVLKEYNK